MVLAGDGTTSTWWAESRLSLAKAIGGSRPTLYLGAIDGAD
jgi:hypothetical protein